LVGKPLIFFTFKIQPSMKAAGGPVTRKSSG
jgi:hypothetical protein